MDARTEYENPPPRPRERDSNPVWKFLNRTAQKCRAIPQPLKGILIFFGGSIVIVAAVPLAIGAVLIAAPFALVWKVAGKVSETVLGPLFAGAAFIGLVPM
jgi:hypothetical protein